MKRLVKFVPIILIVSLFVGGIVVRLYRFDNPIADWHSWRQADTAAVTRNFIKEGFTPLYPKFDSFNSLNELNLPNPDRYFFAEFPLYNIIVYQGYTIFHSFSIEQWGRIVSIFFSCLGIVWLYLLVKHYSAQRVAFIAAFVYAFLPYNIYYGRVIMPDPMHVSFGILTLLLVSYWTASAKWWWSLLAGFAFAITVLTKPYGLVLLFPISCLLLAKWKLKAFVSFPVYLFLLIGLVPFFMWRYHIDLYPQGQFGTLWLYNQGNIRFTGAYFRWLIFDRMNRLIFATGGFVLFWVGIIIGFTKREGLLYFSWLTAILVFFVIIAKGNVTHDYYQMPLVPIGAIFIAKGVDFMFTFGNTWYQRLLNKSLALVLCVLMFAFGWYEVRDFFNVNRPDIVAAGKAIDALTPPNAKVIAPYDLDPSFLYQTNRHGWTIGGDKIPQWIQEGATHLVSVNYDDSTNYWMQRCTVIKKESGYVIIDLQRCNGLKGNSVAYSTKL